MAQKAEVIFCMTENQRTEVTARFPEAAAKTHCLHPDADVGDPHGKSADAFSGLAEQIQGLIGQKLDDLGVSRVGGAAQSSSSIRSPRRSIEVSTSAETEGNAEGPLRYATRPSGGSV
jgi:hypothetical protein